MQLYINCTAFACSAGACVTRAKTLQIPLAYLPQNSAMPVVASEPTRSGLSAENAAVSEQAHDMTYLGREQSSKQIQPSTWSKAYQ